MSLPAKTSFENPMLARQRLLMQIAATTIVDNKLRTGELELHEGKISKGKSFNQTRKPQPLVEC